MRGRRSWRSGKPTESRKHARQHQMDSVDRPREVDDGVSEVGGEVLVLGAGEPVGQLGGGPA